MNTASQHQGSIEVALAHGTRLLQTAPRLAAEQAGEVLKIVPGHPHARLILGAALRISGQTQAALVTLEPLAREQPHSAAVQLECAVALGEAGRRVDAIGALQRTLKLKPDAADAWRLLADHLDAAGDLAAADDARARYLKAATRDPRLLEAAAALVDNQLVRADTLLRTHLDHYPTDIAALRMRAELAARLRRYADARQLLEECLRLAPSFDAARHQYALVLHRQGNSAAALPEVERLLARDPRDPGYLNLKAAILAHLGEYGESIGIYAAVLKDFPLQPRMWMSYGHSLKTVHRTTDCIAAYRRAIALEPRLGEAYWSLANLKTFRFEAAEMASMQSALQGPDLADEDSLHFHFALGKALEDQGDYAASFSHYSLGNALRKRLHPYDADETTRFVRSAMETWTTEFFAARAGYGAQAPDPIFIVGLPRSGSTLLEQVLASHSLVEGTMELPDLPQIARELASGAKAGGGDETTAFFTALAALSRDEAAALGERYLAATRLHRKTATPFFIDKMPNNWLYAGLIRVILPNAKIIDARRHPLGCGLSVFKQHFARGQSFSYDLGDIGRYYRDYVALMAHIDAVQPGRVHRVFHESMIETTEATVRALLDACELPFEDACLKFHENDRPVRTASSAQVRQPIFRDGLDQWRHFEPWLDELKFTLGPALDAYPSVPVFATSGLINNAREHHESQ